MKKYIMGLGMVLVVAVAAVVAHKSCSERRDKLPCVKVAPMVHISNPKTVPHKCRSGKDSVEFSFQIDGFVCERREGIILFRSSHPEKWDFICTAK